MNLKIQRLHSLALVPQYATDGDAGLDLSYAGDEPITIASGQRKLIGTGWAFEIPYGFVGLIHPRSGLAWKHGITVLNTPGTIDAGYRGEVKVNLYNSEASSFTVEPGMRIAQLVIQRVEYAQLTLVESLSASVRGSGGHGSSGV